MVIGLAAGVVGIGIAARVDGLDLRIQIPVMLAAVAALAALPAALWHVFTDCTAPPVFELDETPPPPPPSKEKDNSPETELPRELLPSIWAAGAVVVAGVIGRALHRSLVTST